MELNMEKNENPGSVKELLGREKRQLRSYIVFLVLYALLFIAFIAWGLRPKEWTTAARSLFGGLLLLPICGFVWECINFTRELARFRELKSYEGDETLSPEEMTRWVSDGKDVTGPVIPPRYRAVLIQILMGAAFSFLAHELRVERSHRNSVTASTEPSIPVLPPSADAFTFEGIEHHRAVTDPDTLYVDLPEQGKPKKWMDNLTIPPQILYEDDLFRIEITGCKAKRSHLEIDIVFTNRSSHKVTARGASDTVYINQMKSSTSLYFGYYVEPGKQEETSISLYGSDIPWYDAFLDEIEFCLEIRDDEKAFSSPESTLVKTEPILIRTEAADPAKPKPVLLQPDEEMKVLYEKDGVRIVRTGLFEDLFIKNGKPGMLSSTFWQMVVENQTADEIVIDHADCEANGRKAAFFDISSTTVPAGRREEVKFNLYGEMPDEETLKDPETVSSVMGLAGALRWPLEKIQTASMTFDVRYTDPSGSEQQVTLKDEWHKEAGENETDEQS